MTDTTNLHLPLIEASQAQKHITHNEALQILDAAIQIAVQDRNRTSPPPSPAEGERHVVAAGASAGWAGQVNAIASYQGGGWTFLTPAIGWCVWSVADAALLVFDGAGWRNVQSLDNVGRLGVNTTADASNRLSVKSNAALFAAINAADGGSGDVRLQVSKEAAAKTASVVFSDNYSGRAEFGLIGSDAFKLKVSADGASFVEALVIDQASGNLALPRGLALTGVIAPAQITSDQNDYNPMNLANATCLRLSSDASRSLTGLATGAVGRIVVVENTGAYPIRLVSSSASSTAANRFGFAQDIWLEPDGSCVLCYDATSSRWRCLAVYGSSLLFDVTQSLTTAQKALARSNIFLGTTQTVLSSGSGTYTTPINCKALRVRMIGAGGGGAGSGSPAGGNGGNGGNTNFGTVTAYGGQGGISVFGNLGGVATGGNVANLEGGDGCSGVSSYGAAPGGHGGAGVFGGAGRAIIGSAGDSGATNTGGGGAGGGIQLSGVNTGGGGGAGGYVEHYVNSPAATYSYAVGAGGSAGTAGPSGYTGGAGGSGGLIVEEIY